MEKRGRSRRKKSHAGHGGRRGILGAVLVLAAALSGAGAAIWEAGLPFGMRPQERGRIWFLPLKTMA